MRHGRSILVGAFWSAVLLLLAPGTEAAGQIIYVDARAPGANDGTSWEDAFLCLQNALEVGAGQEIRVAQGVYHPDERTSDAGANAQYVESGDRDTTFEIPTHATVKGGYAGYGAADPDARDVEAYASILSGDLNDDDVDLPDLQWQSVYDYVTHPSRAHNSRRVVGSSRRLVGNYFVVDGFTITGGHADGSDSPVARRGSSSLSPQLNTHGAGAFVESNGIAFVRCTFYRNTTWSPENSSSGGAAVANDGADPTFEKCTFSQNIAFGRSTSSYGGAFLNDEGNPRLVDCTFVNNVTAGFDGEFAGAAIAAFGGEVEITGCTFTNNRAIGSKGGAVFLTDGAAPEFTACTFSDNVADFGGAVCADDSSRPRLTDCLFHNNRAIDRGYGGALYSTHGCRSTLTRCRLIGNSAEHEGGAVWTAGAPYLMSCLLNGNTATNGGALFAAVDAQVSVRNVTFTANQAAAHGGALYGERSTTSFYNSILWNDSPEEIYLLSATAEAQYSNIQGEWVGDGNISADPLFLMAAGEDALPGTVDDDLRLSLGSPCLDAGKSGLVPPTLKTDLDGNSRIANGQVDLGAYEFHGPFHYYVDGIRGDDTNGGWTPNEAFATIQRGIEAAAPGYTVVVFPAVYPDGIDFRGKPITVIGSGGAPIIEAPDQYAVSCYSAEGRASVLQNFVVRNSNVGVFIAGSSPTIRNVTLAGNDFGIAAYAGANPDVSNCIIWHNRDGDLFGCDATYSCVEQETEGKGNISADPLFADPNGGDYHVLSEKGRYVPAYGLWSFDARTSSCIDAGDPGLSSAAERMPNGGRINMGAYGGTPEASLSEWPLSADLNHDRIVDLADLAILCSQWLAELPEGSPTPPPPRPRR